MADKYDLPNYVLSRLRYYDGQFLKDEDFIDEQKYHLDRRRRHERLLHVAGVAEGLVASAANASTVKITAGTAVDDLGRQILLEADVAIAVDPTWSGTLALTARFREKEDRPADSNSAVPGNTRFSQSPLFEIVAAPAEHAVRLGTVVIASAGAAVQVNATGRVYSGLNLPGPPGATRALRAKGDATPEWAELEGGLSVTRSLSVAQNLTVTGDGAVLGKLGVGTASPQVPLHVVGNATFSGNVGVGTPSPQAGLHVDKGTTNVLALLLSSSGPGWGSGLQLKNTPAGGQAKTFGIYAGSGGLRFHDVDASAERLTITKDGNVGVGTSVPGALLSVVAPGATQIGGTARSQALLVSAGTLGQAAGNELALASLGFLSGNSSSLGVRARRVANGADWTTASIGLGMDVDNTVRAGGASLWLAANGNVGVVTPSPISPLQVHGTITAGNGGGAAGAIGNLQLTGTPASPVSARLIFGTDDTGWQLRFAKNKGGTITDIMTLQDNGNVGIGTTSMGERLSLPAGTAIDFGAGATREGNNGKIGYQRFTTGLDIVGAGADGASRRIVFHAQGGSEFLGNVKLNNDLTVGGKATVAAGALMNQVAIGMAAHGATAFTYESIQLGSSHNLRFYFGTEQKAVLMNHGSVNLTSRLGVMGHDADSGYPPGWGGGIHTWDIAVEGTGRARGGFHSTGWDLAEKFENHEEGLEPGDVVAADPSAPERLARSTEPRQEALLGVISERPALLMGVAWEDPMNPLALALAGRVPVKVTGEGGPIRIGDYLTSSSEPGHAMRATRHGRVIGLALSAFDGAPGERGKVIVFVNPHWWGGR